jgi:hypothetical protein
MSPAEAQDVHRHWLQAMACGDFEAAWHQTDRLEVPRRAGRRIPGLDPASYLRWDGTPLRGQRVLIRCLHGLGDTVQFVRYLPEIRRLAADVVTLAQPALLPLLETTPELGEIINGWTDAPPPPHTVEVEIMELPYLFRSHAANLPAQVPYLNTKGIAAASSLTVPRLPAHSCHIGLVWAASSWDSSRSLPLAALAPLQLPGIEFHSLQQDLLPEDLANSPLPLHPLAHQTSAILDAAAAMLQLDLIITVDTLAAHLAGALGRPVWLLLQHHADWRWQRTGDSSPWYPTMRLFRQPSPGDWISLIQQMAHALKDFRSPSSP